MQSDSHSQQIAESQDSSAEPRGQPIHKDSCTAFVSNLDYAVTADQIREIFCQVCTCAQCKTMTVNAEFAYDVLMHRPVYSCELFSESVVFVLPSVFVWLSGLAVGCRTCDQ